MKDDGFKFFPVSGDGLTALKKYQERLDRFLEDREALREEFRSREDAVAQAATRELRGLWTQIAVSAEVDVEATWGEAEWGIETRYLDKGFGAVTYTPQPQHPLAAMMGDQPEEKADEAEEGAPNDATIN